MTADERRALFASIPSLPDVCEPDLPPVEFSIAEYATRDVKELAADAVRLVRVLADLEIDPGDDPVATVSALLSALDNGVG